MNCPGCGKPLYIIPRQRAILECLECHLVVIYTNPTAIICAPRCDPTTCANVAQCEHGCVGYRRREGP